MDFSLQKGFIEKSDDWFRNGWEYLFGANPEDDTPIYKMGKIRESTRDFEGEELLHLSFRMDALSLELSHQKFTIIDAFAKFAGLERVLRIFFTLTAIALIQPVFMRSLLNDLYLVK